MKQGSNGWINVPLWRWCAQVVQIAIADGIIFFVCVGIIALAHSWLKYTSVDKIQLLSWLSINDIVNTFHHANLVVNMAFLIYHVYKGHRDHI